MVRREQFKLNARGKPLRIKFQAAEGSADI